MKDLVIFFLLLIHFELVYSQLQRPKSYYDDISTESALNYLTEEEEKYFFVCLNTARIDTSNILWIQKNLIDSLRNNNSYCNVLNISISTDINEVKIVKREGNSTLPEPQCLIFIMRKPTNTHILFQVYY